MTLVRDEVARYARHVLLPQVGLAGQERLVASKVLVVGAGGLGSPVLLYLAAAGVGTIGVVDDDVVESSNLQRQVVHADADVGRLKTESAADTVARVNPYVTVVRHDLRLDSSNALEVLRGYDVVVDGTDNFPTRYLVNDACVLLGIPLVWGSVYRFDGQVAVWWAARGPCYRCVFPQPPPPGAV
ncbi:MAG: ThiF family adenylyltransferase, partial [Actinomycetota bacterium]|nr:ThiF family adenylyltransferase [Actinomycetota bacterium]